MKYTTNQISKAGEIITTSHDLLAVSEAVAKVNEWREYHLPVIELLMTEIQKCFSDHAITPVFFSYRLKRMTSIQYKLDLNPDMRLGGMQDIAGGRFVFSDVETLRNAFSLLCKELPTQFEIVKKDDYVDDKPKSSGYRSIHLVYKYHSLSDEDWDNMKVEIQLRTKLQHSWAMAVETAGLVTNTAMKSGQGSDEWQDFFKLISCLFCFEERTLVLRDYCEETRANLIRKLQRLDDKHKFFDQLQALKLSVKEVEKHSFRGYIYLLYIDFNTQHLKIVSFDKSNQDQANNMYNELESKINDKDNAVVLVSVSSVKELKEAYPSYFLDMDDFNQQLNTYLRIGRVQTRH